MIRFALLTAVLPVLVGCTSIPEQVEIDNYKIECLTIDAQPGVAIRKKVKLAELSAAYGEDLPRTFAYASQHGKVEGMPFSIYHTFSPEEVDVEFGCPVARPIEGQGDIHGMSLPGGKVVKTTHYGSYHSLPKAHGAIDQWFARYEVEKNGPPWEVYVDDPTAVAPDKVRTFIFYPIK